jgi:SAM-dependent methyltransferase
MDSASLDQVLQQYVRNGRIPWSPGYQVYKTRLIAQALANENLLECFRCCDKSLPPDYGVGVDERCVEYPWLLTHLSRGSEYLLDAGSVLNHAFILEQPIWQNKTLHVLTLAPEGNCFWQRGISYLYADLRNIPIRDNYYDTVVCISTLEHVGMDNTIYAPKEDHCERPDDFVLAVQELQRVLKPGGQFVLTVPFGEYRNFGIFQQFDSQLLDAAIAAFGGQQVERTFFRYSSVGWQRATETACQACQYVESMLWASSHKHKSELPVEPDHAAAARAVACVCMVKSA